jgi:thiamine-monophosphate kinase
MTDDATALADVRLASGVEFDRIRAFARSLGSSASGLGDDCALIDVAGEILALSVDLSIENIHFRRDWLSMDEIGWRATASALSDLAAVGADVIGVLTAIAMPTGSVEADLEALAGGIGNAVRDAGGKVLGGDLSQGPVWAIDVTVVGRAEHPVRRSGAAAGDAVWVTGVLGGSRAALETWLAGAQPEAVPRARFAHPSPRLAAGRWLASRGARAMIDLSDGLAGDARHLASAGRVGIEIALDRLPIDEGVSSAAARAGEDPRVFAAGGGEDYELLVVLPPDFAAKATAFANEIGVTLTRVGEVIDGHGARMLLAGQEVEIAGFDHFR